MRRERLYLADMVEAADAIRRFLTDVSEDTFLSSDLIRSAVLQKLMIIGEAGSRLPKGFQEAHQEVPWADIIGFRNIATHAYFSVRWPNVWVIASEQAPALRRQIAAILDAEFPGA